MKRNGKDPEFKDLDIRIYIYLMNFVLMILSTVYISIFLPVIKNISICTLIGMYYHQKNNDLMKFYLKASLTSYLGVIAFNPIYNIYIIIKNIAKIIIFIFIIFVLPIILILKLVNQFIYYILKRYYKQNLNYKESNINRLFKKYCVILKWGIGLQYVIILI